MIYSKLLGVEVHLVSDIHHGLHRDLLGLDLPLHVLRYQIHGPFHVLRSHLEIHETDYQIVQEALHPKQDGKMADQLQDNFQDEIPELVQPLPKTAVPFQEIQAFQVAEIASQVRSLQGYQLHQQTLEPLY
jgi:hypothetical protein